VRLGEVVRPALEVADDDLGREVLHHLEVARDLRGDRRRSAQDVRPHGVPEAHPIVFVDDVQPVDAMDVGALPLEALLEEVDRALRRDHFDLVPLRDEMLEDHARPHRVPHPFAHHPVEDSHARQGYHRQRSVGGYSPSRSRPLR